MGHGSKCVSLGVFRGQKNCKVQLTRKDLVEQEAQCPAQGSSSSHLEDPVVAVPPGNIAPRLTWCTGCRGHTGCCWTQHSLAGI